MAAYDRTILNHYNIANPYPTQWPEDNDDSDGLNDENATSKTGVHRSKSRYSALERNRSRRRTLVPGSEKTSNGLENLVQRDEADPLGATNSVVRVLRDQGLLVEDDELLRNRFLLSSTTFTPGLYLSQVHANASTQSLLQGLEYLSRSIDQKSASLKVLVESNFERFVRAKTTIDNVYTQMRTEGNEPEVEKPRTHSRHTSRTSTHFRSTSGQGPPIPSKSTYKPPAHDKRKHALTKESEYGVQGIKIPLIEVAVKAEEVWGPALGGRDREENLKIVLSSVEEYQGIFEVGSAILESVRRKDYERLVEGYSRARKYADDARLVADKAMKKGVQLTEPQIHQIVITGRMWLDVEKQIDEFKREVWRDLTSVHANRTMSTDRSRQDDHVGFISVLLELGVEDNPIWVWLLSRYDYLKNKINSTFDRSRVEIEVLRRQLANAEKPSLFTHALHLKNSASFNLEENARSLDTTPITELWELIYSSLGNFLSTRGVLGEVIDFWDKTQSFIDGKVQRTLPVGFNGDSRKHHRLSTDGVRDLQNGAVELTDLIREHVFSFFVDPPIEDISMLHSPLPTATPNTPVSAMLSPSSRAIPRFNFDPLSPPPPSPKTGEPWEDFAFWPPYANSLSAVRYLEKYLVVLGTAASEIAAMRPVAEGHTSLEKLKLLMNAARERSAKAVCAAWNKDAEMCKALEDWTRNSGTRDLTQMPSRFAAFESAILSGMQRVLYVSEISGTRSSSVDLITPPSTKLLQLTRSQFVTSLYKALSGMVENAENPVNVDRDDWAVKQDTYPGSKIVKKSTDGTKDTIDASNRNLRMLLTLSNLKALRTDIVPQLVNQFETNFSVKLTDESKTIYDVLGQIDASLFKTYTQPTIEKLSATIREGILSPLWPPNTSRPTEVRPYVYDGLLSLVFVHTEVSTTAAPMCPHIVSHLLEQMSTAFLEAFKSRPKYSLPMLMQATLDVEFVAQTLSQYTTEKASDTQSHIYLELDKRTDNDARQRLQNELPEMRAILKKLREGSRSEFACFKKQRSQKDRP